LSQLAIKSLIEAEHIVASVAENLFACFRNVVTSTYVFLAVVGSTRCFVRCSAAFLHKQQCAKHVGGLETIAVSVYI